MDTRAPTLALMLAAAAPALADEGWVALRGAEIREALADKTLIYEFEKQRFYASGRTSFDAGILDWGHWEVREDRYCSLWPPSDIWTCYDVALRDWAGVTQIRFTGEVDDVSLGTVME
ncbi:MAG: hypothetical protein AAFQ51_18240 [Pseudomonadota bacterium]